MKSVIDIVDLSISEVEDLLALASDMIEHPAQYAQACHGKKLATLFFEPSTRTRLSFEAAMLDLGGKVIGFSDANSSSSVKGESIADTSKVISCYADIIAMRHNKEGAPLVSSCNATIPVINAGDGGHCHPTQTLTDLLTIRREKGRLHDLTVGFCGDLKYGRTVHSLIAALARYTGIKLVLISPEELALPGYVMHETVLGNHMPFEQVNDLEKALPKLDVLYMTRIQKERFADLAEYERLKDSYILTEEKMKAAKSDMIVLHPLPRVNEISVKIDDDPRACYFKQVRNGKFMRMALILTLLRAAEQEKTPHPEPSPAKRECNKKQVVNLIKCKNERCITSTEQELDHVFRLVDATHNVWRCAYCEKKCDPADAPQ